MRKTAAVRPAYGRISTEARRKWLAYKGRWGVLALDSLSAALCALPCRLHPLGGLISPLTPPCPSTSRSSAASRGLSAEPCRRGFYFLRIQQALESAKFTTLSCKIAPTPHLIKCPQSNCVGINGVAMLIFPNNSVYRQIYGLPGVVFGTDSAP